MVYTNVHLLSLFVNHSGGYLTINRRNFELSMPTRTIRISDEAYERLRMFKSEPSDPFSGVHAAYLGAELALRFGRSFEQDGPF